MKKFPVRKRFIAVAVITFVLVAVFLFRDQINDMVNDYFDYQTFGIDSTLFEDTYQIENLN